MFRDTREELERLERQLQEEETEDACQGETAYGETAESQEDEETGFAQEDTSMPADDPAFYRNYANDYTVYNSDRTDVELEQYSEEVRQPKERGLRGLLLLAAVLMAAIACVLAYLVLKVRGVL